MITLNDFVKAVTSRVNDSFQNFQQNLGIGTDNATSGSTYGYNPITRNRVLLEFIHRGSWVGGVAIDAVADDMTRAGVDVGGEDRPQNILAVNKEAVHLDIWGKFNEAIKAGRLYGGAILVLLIDGQDTSTTLRMDTVAKGQFKGVYVLDRWQIEPSSKLVSEFGAHLGLPEFYKVIAGPLVGRIFHHTRSFRFVGVDLPYYQRLYENGWGLSILERLYDRLISFDTASAGATQLIDKAYLRTLKVEGLRGIVAAGGDALLGLTQYVDMMRKFQGIEGLTLIDAQDDFSSDSHQAFSGLSDVLAQFAQQLSGALQIPLVRLFGQSPLGFSTGEADLRNYYDTVSQQQEKDLRTVVEVVYTLLFVNIGVKVKDDFSIIFNPLWQLSSMEKAEIANKNVDSISKADEAGFISRQVAMRELKQQARATGVFSNISEEDIAEAKDDEPPLPGGVIEVPGEVMDDSEVIQNYFR
jgi:phage-related protein (TIGR01555 family)